MKRRIILLLTIIAAGMFQAVRAQEVALKTNLLADGFFSPNLGIEAGLAPRYAVRQDISKRHVFDDHRFGSVNMPIIQSRRIILSKNLSVLLNLLNQSRMPQITGISRSETDIIRSGASGNGTI